MTRSLLLVVPLVAALAALLGSALDAGWAVPLAVVLGAAAAGMVWAIQHARVTAIARDVNSWLGPRPYEPIEVRGGAPWRQLSIAINALGAAFDRRGQRLATARQRRIQLVDAVPEPALLFGDDGYLVRANPAARSRFGFRQGEPLTAAQALGSAQLARAVDEARDGTHTVEIEADIGERNLAAIAAPVGDEVLLLVADRTERRRVDAVRRDFVANASHELKTPVSGIQALSEALEVTVDRDPARARSLTRRLAHEAQQLSKLVHDLLDLRRLEEDAPRQRVAVDLAALIRSEFDRLQPTIAERRLEASVDLPESALVVGTEEDLRLIVANLLDNAVGYNRPQGSIEVRLFRVDGSWRLEVSDSGIGIARQDLDRVFERFYRVDVARSRATGGTGLGLSIVRHAVERHGGTVSVESILGEGTTFSVVLPVEPAG